MSELEIQRRQEYKENRKKWALIQLIAIVVLVALSLSMFLVYNRMNRTYYIDYTENSNINYKVQYEKNDFFDDEWVGKDQTYISSLVNGISADFLYKLNMDSSDMGFNYKYVIVAKLVISDKDTNAPFFTVEDEILPQKSGVVNNTSSVKISENVFIDYVKYDDIARDFIQTYNLKNATATLIVSLNVDVLSSNKQFENDSRNNYTTSLNIPVAEDSFSIFSTTSSPANESKVLVYNGIANKDLFLVLSVIALVLAGLGGIALLVFLQITKNEDITYAARIRKILNAYGSYIQRMEGDFDCEGYQIIMIKTFTEMLGIRDTIQSPVIMSENRDETMTCFYIPTNTKILYTFVIKVDNYDEIYSKAEEPVEEEPVILETIDEEDLVEAMAQPDIELEEIDFVPDDDDQFEVAPEEEGIEVVGVVWPERKKNNKVYRYDPNGEILEEGDLILVPTRDAAKGVDIVRKVAVAHGNHRVDPEHIKHPLKKVIAIIKRKTMHALTPNANEEIQSAESLSNREE